MNGIFGTQKVISVKNDEGNERFYVMALSNVSSSYFYYNARNVTTGFEGTGEDFGSGESNTETWRERWTNESYGSQSTGDVFYKASSYLDEGWFIPSACEAIVAMVNLSIDSSNCSTYGLDWYYLTSTVANRYKVALIYPGSSKLSGDGLHVLSRSETSL